LTNFITLTNEFFNPTNTAIISTIEDGEPILIENKGKYTDAQLDNYLGEFDTIDTAYTEGLLSEEHPCISFSYYAGITNENKEITAYIKSQRRTQGRDSSAFFLGFSKVVKVVAESGLPDCRSWLCIICAIPRASLRSVLLVGADSAAFTWRVSTQITGRPAPANAL
jgi:hypothetical protein